jgi:integrase
MAQQDGTLFVVGNACYLKYYTIGTDGERARHTVRLCAKSDVYDWSSKAKKGSKKRKKKKGSKKRKWSFSRAVVELQRETMGRLKAEASAAQAAALAGQKATPGEMRVVDLWDTKYLPYLEAIVPLTGLPRRRPSTVRGFKQIWNQHLKAHFGTTTLKDYEPAMGKRLLRSLLDTQGKNTLKHIKALAGSLFSYAVDEEFIKVNPWHDVRIPDDAIESKATKHYTLPEVEDMISALVDHVDAQLVIAVACFLGLRPGEIAALRWEDFDDEQVHIRRSVVRGVVGAPKTAESSASLPLPGQVIIPLELWRAKCGRPVEGYVFNSRDDTPVDLHNFVARIIKPHVEGKTRCVPCNRVPMASGVQWKSLYAGRRCAATAVIEANGGNLAIGQALLRHKSQITTATFYKKSITPQAFRAGMKQLELAAKNGSDAG